MDDAAKAEGRRRSLRDWCVDTVLFLLAVSYGVLTSGVRTRAGGPGVPPWLFDLDQLVGALGCAALWLRRRWPVQLAVVLVIASAFSELVAGAMVVALFTVAVHRRPRTAGVLFALSLLAALVYVTLRPEPGVPAPVLFGLGAAIQGAAVGWGLFISQRRQVLRDLRDRAVRAEAEAALRAERAQREARDSIAREIHDLLGHRLSLLSVHAGALEYRPDASPADVQRAARVIRESSHQALQDLRDVIGVLHAPVGELPQPALADLSRLIDECTAAGMRITLSVQLVSDPPDRIGRTAYRIIQEALTNARRHAPGAAIEVKVSEAADEVLAVEVRNGQPATGAPQTPGEPGLGLPGLVERTALVGGQLSYGPDGVGGWQVSARLPWRP